MANNKGLILWTLGGAGVFLLYAAFKNQSPTDLLVKHLTNSSGSVASISGNPSSAPSDPSNTWGKAQLTPGQSEPLPGQATQDFIPVTPIGYRGVQKNGDTYYAIDASGVMVSALPAVYQSNPGLYVNAIGA